MLAPFFTGDARVEASITVSVAMASLGSRSGTVAIAGPHSQTTSGRPLGTRCAEALLPGMQDADIYPPEGLLEYDPLLWQSEEPKQYKITKLPVVTIIAAIRACPFMKSGSSQFRAYKHYLAHEQRRLLGLRQRNGGRSKVSMPPCRPSTDITR